jgi:putative hydrolase of the HAD superfamily
MRFADIGAVTVDGFGTLIEVESPVPRLEAALAARGLRRTQMELEAAFAAEVAYYRPRAHSGRDEATLAALRRDCVRVFLDELGIELEAEEFVYDFMGALVFRPVDGAVGALETLRARDLRLAVVSNWDCSLPETLTRVGLRDLFEAVVTSAEAGAPKPDPAPFLLALRRLGADAHRTLHVGDEEADALGARAAGMAFAPSPLARAVEGLG